MALSVSAIVRTKDKRDTIERCLESLRAQDVEVEIVVVDSGSTDGTLEYAGANADTVISIAPEDFTFGGALNLGAERARGDIHLPLSAHCWLPTTTWVSEALVHYGRPEVAATNGADVWFDGSVLDGPTDQTYADAERAPEWGYSNHAASWRASVWRKHRFSETLDASEDKEWALRVLADGGNVIVHDPRLNVGGRHRVKQGMGALFDRSRREERAIASFAPHRRTAWMLVRNWWHSVPAGTAAARLKRRFSPYRPVELAGRAAGQRDVRRRTAG